MYIVYTYISIYTDNDLFKLFLLLLVKGKVYCCYILYTVEMCSNLDAQLIKICLDSLA